MKLLLSFAVLAACGAPPVPAAPVVPAGPIRPQPVALDPDLNRPPPRRLLSIDWAAVPLATDADALALWARIAPTGEDWEEKLDEVPAAVARRLAPALLRAGNFTCVVPVPPRDCAPPVFDVDPPAHGAALGDPCLRRLLALWSIAQLEPEDVPGVLGALRAIAAIPPPESQLVAAALRAIPEAEPALLLELLVIAWRAGQREVVDSMLTRLDEPQLLEAATKHHIASALEVLSAEGHRAAYLAAVTDEAMPSAARARAISDLLAAGDALAPDLRAALVKAAGSPDCAVAAVAARELALRGDRRFVPVRPRTRSPAAMLRALCVLASYEPLREEDEPSLLSTYLPPKGLERIEVAFDALSDVDPDGDGDPRTERRVDLVPRAEAVLPEQEDLARAMKRCTGAVCMSADREFRFHFRPGAAGELYLWRLELVERPPCP